MRCPAFIWCCHDNLNLYMNAILYLKLTEEQYRDNFLYFVYGAWMLVGASADLVTLEEEYPAWVVL